MIRYYFPSEEIEIATDDSRDYKALAPIDSVSTRGLEIRLWVVDDTQWSAARMLSLYANESDEITDGDDHDDHPIASELRSRWSDWGFRLIAIPIDEVEGFLGGLRPVQPINVQWLGEFGQWRAVVRAGELRQDRVRVGERSVKIEPGRPRLIARSWVEPMLTPGDVVPGVRLDLALQIEDSQLKARRQRDAGFFNTDQERSIEDDGAVIDELILSMMLDGSQAIILIGEAPGVDWSKLPEPMPIIAPDAGADEDESEAQDTGAFGPRENHNPAGDGSANGQDRSDSGALSRLARSAANEPSKPTSKTLGELMLTVPGSRMVRANETRIVPKRVIVVLIPRVQGGYSLLSGAGVQPVSDERSNP